MKVYTDAEFHALAPEFQEMLRRNGWSAGAPPEPKAQSARCALATGSKAVPSAEENRLRGLLDDANGKIHILQSMMAEAGYPMRVKWGEDLHGNEDWVRVRPECQLRDVLRRLAELTTSATAASNDQAQRPGTLSHTNATAAPMPGSLQRRG